MASFMNWIVNKIRFRRFAMSGARTYYQFAIYYGPYSNWKETPKPVVFILFSGERHIHGIAIQYMTPGDKSWFARTLYLLRRGNQVLDGNAMYRFLKTRRPSIVKNCYRMYFTPLFDGKMISYGLTNRFDEVYKGIYNDRWIDQLNENLMPSAMPGSGSPGVAFSQSELSDRVIHSQNSIPITQRSIRRAPWAQQGNKAPWVK